MKEIKYNKKKKKLKLNNKSKCKFVSTNIVKTIQTTRLPFQTLLTYRTGVLPFQEMHQGLDLYRVIKISCVGKAERDSLLRSVSCGFESIKK